MLIQDVAALPGWLGHHAHLWLLGAANGIAWAQTLNTGNLSVGTVVTVCTIAVPAVGGAVIYIIKTVGPVWLKFLADRDAMRSNTIAGQMERLNRNLEAERESGAAKAELARQLKAVADLATQRADMTATANAELSGKLAEVLAKMDESAARTQELNERFHKVNNALQKAEARALNAEHDATTIRAKLDEALAKLNMNTAKFDDNSVKLDAVTARVDGITDFGAAVAVAADALVHPEVTQPTNGTHGG